MESLGTVVLYLLRSEFLSPFHSVLISIGNFSILNSLLDFSNISSFNLPSGHFTSPRTAAKNDNVQKDIGCFICSMSGTMK